MKNPGWDAKIASTPPIRHTWSALTGLVTVFDTATVELISRPCVVEVLACLAEHAQPLSVLRSRCHAPRRRILTALRSLATAEVVHRVGRTGTWDHPGDHSCVYALTAAGRSLVNRLSDLDGWVNAHSHPGSGIVPE